MSLLEAAKGATAELAAISNPRERLLRAVQISRIFAEEVFGLIFLVPYGWRALRTYRSIPRLQSASKATRSRVSMVQDVRYGPRARNVMDIYLPAALPTSSATGSKSTSPAVEGPGRPVALFCHGGVWAGGEKWQFAPMALCLAQAGVVTVVMHYSLYPKAGAAEMTREVSEAITWTLDNIESYNGNSRQVSLLGHSAGGQLCAMALLHRACTASRAKAGRKASSAYPDARMPARFLGLAAVYDIAKHYEYEAGRGVAELSTMKRAIGGQEQFGLQSPAVVLARALERAGAAPPVSSGDALSGWQSYYESFTLKGQAIAQRTGFERPARQPAIQAKARRSTGSSPGGTGGCTLHGRQDAAAASAPQDHAVGPDAPADSLVDFDVSDAAHLPPCVLLSSCRDRVVPWHESAEMFWHLHDCGVPCKHLMYEKPDHAAFVIDWPPLHGAAAASREPCETGLPDFAQDMVKIITGQVDISGSSDMQKR